MPDSIRIELAEIVGIERCGEGLDRCSHIGVRHYRGHDAQGRRGVIQADRRPASG